jgi:hypothetical protein
MKYLVRKLKEFWTELKNAVGWTRFFLALSSPKKEKKKNK